MANQVTEYVVIYPYISCYNLTKNKAATAFYKWYFFARVISLYTKDDKCKSLRIDTTDIIK